MKHKHFAVTMVMLLCSIAASAETLASGSCGESLTWTLAEDGELTIAGVGAMADFVYSSDIPWYAHRASVTKATIQDGVTSIGNLAFYGTSVVSVSIGKDVTSIGNDAFLMCRSLTSISIPEGVTEIGNEAFYDCTGLASVTLPSSLKSIDYGAFYSCKNLTSVSMSEGLASIGEQVFAYCTSLTSIVIPASVTSIGRNVFSNSTNLTTVTCMASAVPTTDYSFDSSAPIATLYVPAASLSLYQSKWEYYFTNIKAYDPSGTCGDGVSWSLSYDGELKIEGAGAMADYSSASSMPWAGYVDRIKSVVVEDGVTRIGDRAFYECTSLASVEIPESVESIGAYAFLRCTSLVDIVVPQHAMVVDATALDGTAWYNAQPDGIVYLGAVVYGYKGEMPENSNLAVRVGTKVIGAFAFEYCTNLVGIEIPKGVTYIGEKAFYTCSSLVDIAIPESLVNMGYAAFDGTAWYDAQPDGVVYMGNFLYCYKGTMPAGTSVAVREGTKSIVDYAFNGRTGLTSITIPASVTSIGTAVFLNCSKLTEVHIDDLRAWCNISFADYNSNPLSCSTMLYLSGELVTELVIPEGVVKINDNAFYACTSLTSVTIPESVTEIGERAFMHCPASYICKSLTPPTVKGSYALYGHKPVLYVQEKAIEAYKTVAGWSEFSDIRKSNLAITINQYGSATYSSEYALDFCEVEGLKAYAATGYNPSTGVVTLTRVMTAKAGVGLFLKGEPGEYTVPVLESTDDNSLNMLVGTLESTPVNSTSDDGLYYNYRYTIKDGDEAPLFYRIDDGYTLGAGKAYLQIPVAWMPAEAKSISLRFDDGGTTDIDEMESEVTEPVYYDLMGRKVVEPQKRNMYIVNGKKIIFSN